MKTGRGGGGAMEREEVQERRHEDYRDKTIDST